MIKFLLHGGLSHHPEPPDDNHMLGLSGGQESYPLRIFTLGRSGRWTAAGRSSAGRQTADGRSSDGRPAGRPGGARVVSGAEKKII